MSSMTSLYAMNGYGGAYDGYAQQRYLPEGTLMQHAAYEPAQVGQYKETVHEIYCCMHVRVKKIWVIFEIYR